MRCEHKIGATWGWFVPSACITWSDLWMHCNWRSCDPRFQTGVGLGPTSNNTVSGNTNAHFGKDPEMCQHCATREQGKRHQPKYTKKYIFDILPIFCTTLTSNPFVADRNFLASTSNKSGNSPCLFVPISHCTVQRCKAFPLAIQLTQQKLPVTQQKRQIHKSPTE